MKQYNKQDILEGNYPSEIQDDLNKPINFGLYRGSKVIDVIDVHPIYLLRNRLIFKFSDNFINFLREMISLREKLSCPAIYSLKSFRFNHSV